MRVVLMLLLIGVLAGCKDQDQLPAGVLPPAKMKLVMYDMMRTGEFLSGYVLYKDEAIDKTGESMKWYNKVWEIHKINEEQFRQSYNWYRQHPKKMETLMDSIILIPAPVNPVPKSDSTSGNDTLLRSPDDKVNTSTLREAAIIRQDSLRSGGLLLGRGSRKDSLRRLRKVE